MEIIEHSKYPGAFAAVWFFLTRTHICNIRGTFTFEGR